MNEDNNKLKLNNEENSNNIAANMPLVISAVDSADQAELASGSLYLAAGADRDFKQSLKSQFIRSASLSLEQNAAANFAESSQANSQNIAATGADSESAVNGLNKNQIEAIKDNRKQTRQNQDSGNSLAFIFPFLGGVTFGLVMLVAVLNSGLVNTDLFLPPTDQPILVDNQRVLEQVYANNAPELISALNGEFKGLGSILDVAVEVPETPQTTTSTVSSAVNTSPNQTTATVTSAPVVVSYVFSTSRTVKTFPGNVLDTCSSDQVKNLLQAAVIVETYSAEKPELGRKIVSYDISGRILSTEVYKDNKLYIYRGGDSGVVIDLALENASSASVTSAVNTGTQTSVSVTSAQNTTSTAANSAGRRPQVQIVEQDGQKVYEIATETALNCVGENAELISKSLIDPISFKVTSQETYLKQGSLETLLYTAVTTTTNERMLLETLQSQLNPVSVRYVPERLANVKGINTKL